ncbi:MAG TPA: hypothetical protein VER14_02585 [Phototrophicaceae bacterium]|nr:hypothetical protein [Phototrophicaceae bacterium]
MGYAINTASKTTWLARPNQIVIGDAVYKRLDDSTKQNLDRLISIVNHGVLLIIRPETFIEYIVIH